MDHMILGVLMTLAVGLNVTAVAVFFENDNVFLAFGIAVMAALAWQFVFSYFG